MSSWLWADPSPTQLPRVPAYTSVSTVSPKDKSPADKSTEKTPGSKPEPEEPEPKEPEPEEPEPEEPEPEEPEPEAPKRKAAQKNSDLPCGGVWAGTRKTVSTAWNPGPLPSHLLLPSLLPPAGRLRPAATAGSVSREGIGKAPSL